VSGSVWGSGSRRVASDRFPHVEVRSVGELRAWLAAHGDRDEAVWLVTYKKVVPDAYLSADDVLDELVAAGWTDGVRRRVDDERVMQLVSPRRTQPWMASYKVRAERLQAEGRMTPRGAAAVDAARRSGAWDAMAEVDALLVPEDLAAALDARPPARDTYDAFPPSTRRNVLRWVASAKRATTRAARVERVAEDARRGVRTPTNG
jgi:uncharacterized protein YdeI (YjbR/CyaY-like superfamily)